MLLSQKLMGIKEDVKDEIEYDDLRIQFINEMREAINMAEKLEKTSKPSDPGQQP